jgi:hypothetical protein
MNFKVLYHTARNPLPMISQLELISTQLLSLRDGHH